MWFKSMSYCSEILNMGLKRVGVVLGYYPGHLHKNDEQATIDTSRLLLHYWDNPHKRNKMHLCKQMQELNPVNGVFLFTKLLSLCYFSPPTPSQKLYSKTQYLGSQFSQHFTGVVHFV